MWICDLFCQNSSHTSMNHVISTQCVEREAKAVGFWTQRKISRQILWPSAFWRPMPELIRTPTTLTKSQSLRRPFLQDSCVILVTFTPESILHLLQGCQTRMKGVMWEEVSRPSGSQMPVVGVGATISSKFDRCVIDR